MDFNSRRLRCGGWALEEKGDESRCGVELSRGQTGEKDARRKADKHPYTPFCSFPLLLSVKYSTIFFFHLHLCMFYNFSFFPTPQSTMRTMRNYYYYFWIERAKKALTRLPGVLYSTPLTPTSLHFVFLVRNGIHAGTWEQHIILHLGLCSGRANPKHKQIKFRGPGMLSVESPYLHLSFA